LSVDLIVLSHDTKFLQEVVYYIHLFLFVLGLQSVSLGIVSLLTWLSWTSFGTPPGESNPIVIGKAPF
jgi:hypothetical protein